MLNKLRLLLPLFLLILILGTASFSYGQFFNKILGNKKNNSEQQVAPSSPFEKGELTKVIRKYNNHLVPLFNQNSNAKGPDNDERIRKYMESVFQENGLRPWQSDNFFQPFSYTSRYETSTDSRFIIDRQHLLFGKDAFAFPFSKGLEIRNYVLPNTREFGQPWLISLQEIFAGRSIQEKSNPFPLLYEQAQKAFSRGAEAIVFYDSVGNFDLANQLSSSPNTANLATLNGPVLFLRFSGWEKVFKNLQVLTPFYLNLRFRPILGTAYNEVGFIDNKASRNVLISGFMGDDALTMTNLAGLSYALAKQNNNKYNYIFALFPLSDPGKDGLNAFLDKYKSGSKMNFVVSIDGGKMVPANDSFMISGVNYVSNWTEVFKAIAEQEIPISYTEVATDDTLMPVPILNRKIPIYQISNLAGLQGFSNPSFLSNSELNRIENSVTLNLEMINKIAELDTLVFVTSPQQQKQIMQRLRTTEKVTAIPSRSNTPKPSGNRDLTTPQKVAQKRNPPAPIGDPRPTGSSQARRVAATKPSIQKSQNKSEQKTGMATPNQRTFPSATTPTVIQNTKRSNFNSSPSTLAYDSVELKHTVGIEIDKSYEGYGVRIDSVMSYSSASRAGLAKGDIIMEMKKVKINNQKDYTAVLNSMTVGDEIYIRIKRGNLVENILLVNF